VPTKRNQALVYRKVPKFLQELRRRAGLTQRELADRIGESQWWVYRCESGSRRVDVAEFILYCDGCRADVREAIIELARVRP
jgi:transcriptional regulator with XRE-family HTH domain